MTLAARFLLLGLATCGCTVNPHAVAGVTVTGQAVIAGESFATQANRYVKGDIDHIAYKLLDSTTLAQVGSTYTVAKATQTGGVFGATTSVRFLQVPNGSYRMSAEAFNGSGATISQTGLAAGVPIAGAILSTNTVTVDAAQVPPVSANLTVALKLLDATGETIDTAASIADGQAWTGTPVGSL